MFAGTILISETLTPLTVPGWRAWVSSIRRFRVPCVSLDEVEVQYNFFYQFVW